VELAQLGGTRAEGTLRVSESAVNELLNLDGSALRGATIPIGAGHQIVLRYGAFRVRATLSPEIEAGPSPRVTLSLASFVVAFAIKAALRQPYISVTGRQLTITLADLPALQRLRDFWSQLRRAELATEPGSVRIDVVVSVAEATNA
jgi:hypothetical protein